MVWWPFAPQPERADTSEVTDLYSGAPPLYSTVKSILAQSNWASVQLSTCAGALTGLPTHADMDRQAGYYETDQADRH